MGRIPKAQEIYKHFKGNLYQIISVAEHTETGEMLVVYQAMYGDFKIYARPLDMFVSKVDSEKYPDAEQEYRFQLIEAWTDSLDGEQEANQVQEKKSVEADDSWIFDWDVSEEESTEGNEDDDWADLDIYNAAETASVAVAPVTEEAEAQINSTILDFLNEDSCGKRLNILAGMHHRITDDMIDVMAMASGVEIPEGDLETRYSELYNCLVIKNKYEKERKW